MGRSYVTFLLIAANALVFSAMVNGGASVMWPSPGAMVELGAIEPVRVWSGEGWRLLSAMFVHGGLLHFAMNMFVLWQVGELLETAVGSARYLLLYIVAGVAGFGASLFWNAGLTAGASGAIFGVIGGLLAMVVVYREHEDERALGRSLLPLVILNLVAGFLLPFVDNAAHIAGLVIGFLFGYAFLADGKEAILATLVAGGKLSEERADARRVRGAGPVLALAVAGLVIVVGAGNKPAGRPAFHSVMGHDAVLQGDAKAASAAHTRLETIAPRDVRTALLGAHIAQRAGDVVKARRILTDLVDPLSAHGQGLLRRVWPMDAGAKRWNAASQAIALATPGVVDENGLALFADEAFTASVCYVVLRDGQPADPEGLNNCAWLLAVANDPAVRAPDTAVAWAKRAVQPAEGGDVPPAFWHTLAIAYAAQGNHAEARRVFERMFAETPALKTKFAVDYKRVSAL